MSPYLVSDADTTPYPEKIENRSDTYRKLIGQVFDTLRKLYLLIKFFSGIFRKSYHRYAFSVK